MMCRHLHPTCLLRDETGAADQRTWYHLILIYILYGCTHAVPRAFAYVVCTMAQLGHQALAGLFNIAYHIRAVLAMLSNLCWGKLRMLKTAALSRCRESQIRPVQGVEVQESPWAHVSQREPCVLTEHSSTTVAGHQCKPPRQLLVSLSFPRQSFLVVSKPAIMAAQGRPSDPPFSRLWNPCPTAFLSACPPFKDVTAGLSRMT